MNNHSSVTSDALQSASSNGSAHILQADLSNQKADIFLAPISQENTDISQDVTSSVNITRDAGTSSPITHVDIFQPIPSILDTPLTENAPSTGSFDTFQSTPCVQKPKPEVQKTPGSPFVDLKSNSACNQNTPKSEVSNNSQQNDSPDHNTSWLQGIVMSPPCEFSDTSETQSSMNNGPEPFSGTSASSPQVDIFQPLSNTNVEAPITEVKTPSQTIEVYQSPLFSQDTDVCDKPKQEQPNTLRLCLRNNVSFSEKTPSPGSLDAYQIPSTTRELKFDSIPNGDISREHVSATSLSTVTPDEPPLTHSSIFHSMPIFQVLSSGQASANPCHQPIPNGKSNFARAKNATENLPSDKKMNTVSTPGGIMQENNSSYMTNQIFSSSSSQENAPSTGTWSEFSQVLPGAPKAALIPKVSFHSLAQEEPGLGEEGSPLYVNIEFTGEERCIEDWPEDSPQLASNWKPSGTFRLRRESLVEKGNGTNGSVKSGRTSLKKLTLSVSTRRRSKSKKQKLKGPQVLRRKSKEKLSVGDNTPDDISEGPEGKRTGSHDLPTSPTMQLIGVEMDDSVFSPIIPE
ncbi:uncharacterized protein LOC134442442, partial [Engraulis encrasicolus]|uniref:uncharacterized protein LOC134442442 n=1 Tax=Engraulis encrasicolus TaxID=184585 RepID=UPI002FD776CD